MSVYKPKKSSYYQFDFQIGGRRFFGSTECSSRKEAEKFEGVEREKAKALVKAVKRSKTSLLLGDVVARLWNDEAQYDAASDATWTNLERLVNHFGEATPLTDIDHNGAKKMVAWRRGHRVSRRGKRTKGELESLPLVANATVNRSTTRVLQRIFRFARSEGAVFESEPKWSELLLSEPAERVRELQDAEEDAFDEAMRSDYEAFFAYVRVSGMRLKECVLLRWSEVNFATRQIVKIGKGGRRIVFPITDTIREIIFPLQGQHDELVFTYVAQQSNRKTGRIRGKRYPLTYNGTKSAWQKIRAAAGVIDFRFHDYRHDFGTKLLRDSGNLKLVQKAMNHKDIKSTMRYAHVLDEDVAAAVERVAKSREKSRTKIRKVS
jgi:integrase